MMAKLWGVSTGPGDPGLMTVRAVRVTEAADVVFAPRTNGRDSFALRIARGACDLAGKRIVRVDFPMGGDRAAARDAYRSAADAIVAEVSAGRDVAMLNLGDIGIYSTFSHVASLVGAAGCEVERIAGVPSFCAVAARLGVSLTESADDPITVVSGRADGLRRALDAGGAVVVMKAGRALADLTRELESRGRLDRAGAVTSCGCADERVYPELADVPDGNAGYFTTAVVRP